MGIFDITPSIRLDTEAFNNALKELNLSKAEFNSQLRRAGVSLGNQQSKTNYLNKLLKDAGKPELRYKNIITSKPSKTLTTKGQVEVGMGGERPGQRGAPNNAKIWNDGTKVQKVAEKKFKNVTDQRKYFVDTMKKIYKNIPKKQILELFKNVVKGIKTASPMGLMQELSMDMIEKNPGLLSMMPGNTEPMTFNEGGIMDINEMTRPISMQNGGDPVQERMEMLKDSMRDDENKRMVQPDVTSVALKIAQQQGDTSEANINMIIRQLMAMVPSVNQTMKDELTPTMSRGLTGLLDRIGVMLGQKSDPKLNRNVGFSRVR
jgi:hypothetical protein